MSRPYDLPPFASLAAFEAAARHESFKTAARELNVTPGAVSHQIKALEANLNVTLFHRANRGVTLTDAGLRLAARLRTGFQSLSDSISEARETPDRARVTVGATTAVSALWLTPAVSRFWRASPQARLDQIVSDTLDFGVSRPDLVVSYGEHQRPGYVGQPLFTDTLVPVCAPDLAQAHPHETLADLRAMPLVHLDVVDARWTTWTRWFAEHEETGPLRKGIRVNNYMIALQAARDGAGMVLGWQRLVRPLLQSGRLVALNRFSLPAPLPFVLSRLNTSDPRQDTNALYDWLLSVGQGQSESSSLMDEIF